MEEKGCFHTKDELKNVDLLDISVVIPVHNKEKYLLEIFHSIDNQSLPPREMVIVDSSSSNIISNLINEWNGTVPCTAVLCTVLWICFQKR